MRPCRVVKIQNSHSITRDTVLSPTTKKPRAQVMPRIGISTKEACSKVLREGGGRGARVRGREEGEEAEGRGRERRQRGEGGRYRGRGDGKEG